MSLQSWFEKGMTFEEYTNQMSSHKENMQSVYDQFEPPFQVEAKPLRAIVLTEDWCGDAMMNIPVLAKLAESAGMELRFLLRDSNLELMDQYLTNGTSRAIPIFIFIDENGNEAGKWGPRATIVQSFVDDARSNLPAKEDPAFEDGQKLMIKQLTAAYVEREDFWNAVYEEVANVVQKVEN